MSLRVRPNARAVALLGSLSFAAACGGTVSDVNGRNGRLSGVAGGSGGGLPESGGTDPFPFPPPDTGGAAGGIGTGGWHSEPAAGGTPPSWVSSGGTDPGGPYWTGGAGGWGGVDGGLGGAGGGAGGALPAGGYAGLPTDAGPPGTGGSETMPIYIPISPSCGYSFGFMALRDSCTATSGCLNLDPATWGPVVPASGADAGASGAWVEAPFCQAPVPGQTYTFAFDEQVTDHSYTSFYVATGTAACEGYSIAYLGFPEGADSPPGSIRTQCFSVDGRFLQSRLAVNYYPEGHFSNLRVVSSCPCARQVPYNTETCPPPNGSAGAPNCM